MSPDEQKYEDQIWLQVLLYVYMRLRMSPAANQNWGDLFSSSKLSWVVDYLSKTPPGLTGQSLIILGRDQKVST